MPDKNYQAAFNFAHKLLSCYPRTVYEIRSKLMKKNYGSDLVDKIISELIAAKQLDDQAYAASWLETQLQRRPCGRLLCGKKLRQRGVAVELITESLDKYYPLDKEVELARQAAQNKKETLSTHGNKNKSDQKIAFYL
ncbi:recombination regulator RecX, partial [Patescibacteria group bacterium]|nr:recombination regulator RecX [Patescibacteria group bacterium]